MVKIQYVDDAEKASILAERALLGHILVDEQNLFTGKFLVFDDNVAAIRAKARYETEKQTDVVLQKLIDASHADIDAWVDANVTSIASAKILFKKMLMVLSYLLNK